MKNLLEDAVADAYDNIRRRSPDFCGCAKCRDDVLSLALNHTTPRYATGDPPIGAALSRLELQSEQGRAKVITVVLDAMKRVAANPRHTPPLGSPDVR